MCFWERGNNHHRGSTLPLPLSGGWVPPPWLFSLEDAALGVSSASPLPDVDQDCRKLSLLRRKSLKRQTSSSGGGGASPRYREVWKSRVSAKFSSLQSFYLIRTTEKKGKKKREREKKKNKAPDSFSSQDCPSPGHFPCLGKCCKI